MSEKEFSTFTHWFSSNAGKWEICVHMANELYPVDAEKREEYVENCLKHKC